MWLGEQDLAAQVIAHAGEEALIEQQPRQSTPLEARFLEVHANLRHGGAQVGHVRSELRDVGVPFHFPRFQQHHVAGGPQPTRVRFVDEGHAKRPVPIRRRCCGPAQHTIPSSTVCPTVTNQH